MDKNKKLVIARDSLPRRSPFWPTVVMWLVADRFGLPWWIIASVSTLIVAPMWFFWFVNFRTETEFNIFYEKRPDDGFDPACETEEVNCAPFPSHGPVDHPPRNP